MQLNWSFSGCDNSDQARITDLWQSRHAELEAKAAMHGETETSQLRLFVEHADASPTWIARAALYLAPETFVSERANNDLAEALDQTLAELSQQIDESSSEPLQDRDGRSKPQRVLPLLEKFHSQRRSDAFFSFLVPLFRSLRTYAQREIRTRRLLGELPTEQVTVSDVLDEALLQAWNRFAKRPRELPLDLWLVQLVDEVIEEGTHVIAQESLDSRRPQPSNEPRGSLQDQWVENPNEPETIELARLLPGQPGVEMWDELDVEVKQSKLDAIFERLSRTQRQVLMLQAVEGFNTATIADFQDRSQQEVEQDLDAARAVLQRMAREWELPDIEERLEQAALKRPRRSHRT